MTNKNNDAFVTFQIPQAEKFAVILAGGDGVRLRQMTKKMMGCETPKQFCPLLDEEPLVIATKKRVGLKFAPEKIFYSLTETHEEFYTPLLGEVSKKNKVIQPTNKGTAPAILYSLYRLSKLNPNASVAFFPADHYISDNEIFMNHVETAFQAVSKKEEAIVLLGIEPIAPKSTYGWIEPCGMVGEDSFSEIQKVKYFWEKPTSKEALELMEKGCLWNSFVMVGKVKNLISLFKKYIPSLYRLFCLGGITIGTSAERMTIKTIYKMISNRNFSFDVLEKCQEELYVLRAGGFGWSDLGEPNEVLLKMAQLGLKNKLFPLAV